MSKVETRNVRTIRRETITATGESIVSLYAYIINFISSIINAAVKNKFENYSTLSLSLFLSLFLSILRRSSCTSSRNADQCNAESKFYNIYTFFWSRLLVTKAYFRLVGMETKK